MGILPEKFRTFLRYAGAVCAFIGLVDLPDQLQKWIKYFQTLAGYSVNWDLDILGNTGRWVFTISGVVLALIGFEIPQRFVAIVKRWSYLFPGEEERIALQEAANIAYERLRESGSFYAAQVEKMCRSAEDKIGWYMYHIPSQVPVFGKCPPSRLYDPNPINKDDFKHGGFNSNNSFSYFGKSEPKYIDLCVNKAKDQKRKLLAITISEVKDT